MESWHPSNPTLEYLRVMDAFLGIKPKPKPQDDQAPASASSSKLPASTSQPVPQASIPWVER